MERLIQQFQNLENSTIHLIHFAIIRRVYNLNFRSHRKRLECYRFKDSYLYRDTSKDGRYTMPGSALRLSQTLCHDYHIFLIIKSTCSVNTLHLALYLILKTRKPWNFSHFRFLSFGFIFKFTFELALVHL